MDAMGYVYFGLSPIPVTVSTRIVIFLVTDPYKPSFATITWRGDNPIYAVIVHVQPTLGTWKRLCFFLGGDPILLGDGLEFHAGNHILKKPGLINR